MAAVHRCERRAATVSPVDHHDAARAAAVVRALSALSPSREPKPSGLVIPLKWFRWLPALAVGLFQDRPPEEVHVRLERDTAQRLAAVDQVRLGQRSLRVGWLFLAGTVEDPSGKPRRVFRPLVTLPVRVEWRVIIGAPRLVAAGDVELTELITDAAARESLESRMAFGGGALDDHDDVFVSQALLSRLRALQFFAFDAAEAAGLPTRRLVPVTGDPDGGTRHNDLVVVAGCGVYAEDAPAATSRAASLLAWDRDRLTTPTALHALYLGGEPRESSPGDLAAVESPFVLTPSQRASVLQSRTAPVTVIAGAPGTGKSHTIAAIALTPSRATTPATPSAATSSNSPPVMASMRMPSTVGCIRTVLLLMSNAISRCSGPAGRSSTRSSRDGVSAAAS